MPDTGIEDGSSRRDPTVPPESCPGRVPGVVFLSGGQSDVMATKHLDVISRISTSKPWKITFSYGRALQDQALATWLGNENNYRPAQQAYYHRAKCNAAAVLGRYDATMDSRFTGESTSAHDSDS